MSKVKYVLMVVFDLALQNVVTLTKKKGPAFLIGKRTFPGGRIEEGECPREAATRELREETGVEVPVSAWVEMDFIQGDGYEMTIFVAKAEDALSATTLEAEPVEVLEVATHRELALKSPDAYAPDFRQNLLLALAACGEKAKYSV